MKTFFIFIAVLTLLSCSTTPVSVKSSSSADTATSQQEQTGNKPGKTRQTSFSQTVKLLQLSDREIEREIRNTIPSSFEPVTGKDNRIKIIYHDLDNNGYKDAFLLVIKKQKGISANIRSLSNVAGLADDKKHSVDYFLSVYLQIKGKMISMFRIPIGSRNVLNSFQPHYIRKGKSSPFGLKISFLTKRGTEVEWIFFSSYNRFSFFTTENTTSVKYEISDIDSDGIEDIIEWKHGLEEGTGYETYLTWYKWNGREFREKATTNVVRNLNTFLETAAQQILRKQWTSFFRNSLNKNRKGIPSGENASALFSRIFTVSPNTEEKGPPGGCSDFRSVVFPKIFENPFKIQSSTLKEIALMVRFECYNGSGFIRTVRVAMYRNPFGKSEYFFILN